MAARIPSFLRGFGTTFATGTVHAAEQMVFYRPYNWAGDGTVRGVLWCHGATQTAYTVAEAQSRPGELAIITALCAAGYPVLVCDLGGDLWGNATARSRFTEAKTYLQGTLGAKSGKVLVVGESMGGLLALNAAAADLTAVAAVAALIPVSDLADFVTNNRGGFASSVNAAYGGAYSNGTYGATSNPTVIAGNGGFGSLPVKLWYGSSDTVVIPSTVTALAAAIGASATAVNVTGGHADSTIVAIPPADIVSFLAAAA